MKPRLDLLAVYAVLFLLFLYGPMLLMPLFSFNDSTFAVFPLKGFTTRNYVSMAMNTSMMAALGNSLVVAVSVSIAATTLAIPAALGLTRHRVPGGGAILSFMMLPLVVPLPCWWSSCGCLGFRCRCGPSPQAI